MVWQCLGSCDGRNWRRREKPYPPSNRHESLSRQADKGNTWLLGLCLTGLRSSLLLKEFIYINDPACLLPSFRSGGIFISCESVAVMLWPLVEHLLRRLNTTNQLTTHHRASGFYRLPGWSREHLYEDGYAVRTVIKQLFSVVKITTEKKILFAAVHWLLKSNGRKSFYRLRPTFSME